MQPKRRPTQKFYWVVMIIILIAGILFSADACDAPGSNNGNGNNTCIGANTCNQNSSGN